MFRIRPPVGDSHLHGPGRKEALPVAKLPTLNEPQGKVNALVVVYT
jgi:hypothetical protein